MITTVLAYGVGAWLTIRANPEVKFWTEVIRLREERIEKLRAERPGTPIILFTGGSSCAFSIDPAIIEEKTGIPAVNMGLPVACGGHYLVHQAMRETKRGDILVVCLEPDLLTASGQLETAPTATGYLLAAASGHLSEAAGGATFDLQPGLSDHLSFLRPGASYSVVLAGKTMVGKGYRYGRKNIGFGGYLEFPASEGLLPAGRSRSRELTAEAREFLRTVEEVGSRRGVKTLYSMPWILTQPDGVEVSRSNKKALLESVAEVMPVLHEPELGVHGEPQLFADSPQHLNRKGATLKSSAVACALKQEL
ncbi:hypothetical protein [Haloferula sp. A504]|uniref:hypothetical protein n=1 Tax=Haloferula sp. A504 TaxID=3373601 RepID=UPI0031C25909|nr:hypothetical protein [Verrucomicrobiaceae bacterium E54]